AHRAGEMPSLALPNDAFSIALLNYGPFRAGPAGGWQEGRHPSDDRKLIGGLHIIDTTIQLGGFAEYWVTPFLRTRVEVLQGVNGDEGLLVNFMGDFVYRPSPVWQFTVGPRLVVVDDQYNQQHFGVTPLESVRAGLPVFNAGGGLESVGVEATAKYDLNE